MGRSKGKTKVPLFTLGSVYSINASGFEQMPETNYIYQNIKGLTIPAG